MCLHKSEDGNGHGQGTSAGYEITDRHCVAPPGNPTKGRSLEEDRRDVVETIELEDYTKGTIWQRIAQDRQMWKQHSEAVAQLRDACVYVSDNNMPVNQSAVILLF